MGSLTLCGEPAQVLERVGTDCRKCGFALVEAAEAVGAEGLQDADVDVGVVVLHERAAIERDECGEAVEIVVEQLLAQRGRQIGLAVVEQRGDVVLQRAFAAALVVEEERLAIAQHDVARLEIAIEKVVVRRGEQEFGEAGEVVFEGLLVEGNAGEAQEIVLEVVQVPGDGLAIEAGARIADFVVQVAAGFDLKARQNGDDFAIGFDGRRGDGFAGAIAR